MGTYPLEEIVNRWTRGDMTTEQMVGQMLLILQDISRRVGVLERLREADRNGNGGRKRPEG